MVSVGPLFAVLVESDLVFSQNSLANLKLFCAVCNGVVRHLGRGLVSIVLGEGPLEIDNVLCGVTEIFLTQAIKKKF